MSGSVSEAGEAPTKDRGPRKPRLSTRDKEFLPAALEILETPPSVLPVALAMAICAFVAAALIWAVVGHLDIYAVAHGKIGTLSRTKVIEPLDPGRVRTIRVRDGDHVKAGEVLIVLDKTSAEADVQSASDSLMVLKAEARRRETAASVCQAFEKMIATEAPTIRIPAYRISWDADIPDRLRSRETAVLDADLHKLAGDLDTLTKKIAERRQTRAKLLASITIQKGLIQTLNDSVDMWQKSVKKEVGSMIQLYSSKQSLAEAQANLADAEGQLKETVATISELRGERNDRLSQFMDDNATKLADVEGKADDTQQTLIKAQTTLGNMTLVSPIDGVVQELAVTTIGQVVTTGQQLMQISPRDNGLIVRALVNNSDIGFVKLGQKAVIKVDAFPFTRFGTLSGRVIQIAPQSIDESDAQRIEASPTAAINGTTMTPSSAPGQQQTYVFPVTISLSQTAMDIKGNKVPLSPGMTVTAEIRTGRRRVIDYVLSPLARIGSEAMRER